MRRTPKEQVLRSGPVSKWNAQEAEAACDAEVVDPVATQRYLQGSLARRLVTATGMRVLTQIPIVASMVALLWRRDPTGVVVARARACRATPSAAA
jgi:hypothetical protein